MGKTLLLSLFSTIVVAFSQPANAVVGTLCTTAGGQCGNGEYCDLVKGPKTKSGYCKAVEANFSAAIDTSTCVLQAESLLSKCKEEQASATDSCDSTKDSGMNQVINTASPFALAAGNNTASSIQAACKGMAGLSQAANAALAAYRLTCNNWIGDCVTSCTEVKKFLKETANCSTTSGVENPSARNMAEEAYDLNRTCRVLNSKVAEADQAIANYTQTAINSTQCSSLTSSTDYLEQMCKTNPNLIACKALTTVDCTSSTMATNKVCVCAKNPLDPTCSLTTTAGGNGNQGNGTGSFSTDTTGGAGADGSYNGIGDLPDLGIEHTPIGKLEGGAPIDGKQGGGAQLGGNGKGGGLSGGRGAGGGAGESNGSQVNAGFYGGGSGGGGFGSGGGGNRGNGYGGQAGTTGKPGGPDLRQFLPGAKYDPKARGLAGVSGPDGITGPNSSIWKKIQNRYQVMGPTLLP
jgi:hypothetical protein